MIALLYILLSILCPFVVVAVIGISKILHRYHNDPAYREKMDKRAKALERKRKATKKRKLVSSSSSDVITDILGF
jgi:hypothetical protein